METITFEDFVRKANRSDTRRRLIPMEFSSGWPSISIKNNQICVTVPYFRSHPGKDGKMLLFPISYLMTLTWPNAGVVEFASLKYRKEYKGIDFGKPVGIFKHDAVKDFIKEEYMAKRTTLFGLYDQLIDCITGQKEFMQVEEMRGLFQIMMEPSLYTMYQNLARNFFDSYCGLL